MLDQTPQPSGPLNAALEKTVPAAEFNAEHTREEVARTAADLATPLSPGVCIEKTSADSAVSREADTTGITRFGASSVIPPELLNEHQHTGPRYTVRDRIGQGATATVYAVDDHSLGRTIALKLLRERGAAKEGVKRRFLHEARVTAMLEHPNIVPVYDIGVTENHQVYFLMKDVTGTSLGDAIRAEAAGSEVPAEFRTIDGKLQIVHKVCDALSFAHDRGFIHQDIKPDNIMVGSYGEVLVLDWGCALGREERDRLRTVGFGTPAYMSPEQARKERADERSDIYCLGATLFHLLTLRHPTWSQSPERFWEMKRAGELSSLTVEEEARVPGPLLAVARKALAADPTERYQSMGELRAAITEYQQHVESVAMAREAIAKLAGASMQQDYQAFAEVTAELRQSLRMWPGNQQAQAGLLDARRGHAACALDRGDLELADSIVKDMPECADLRDRIGKERARRAARQRTARRALRAAVGLGAVVLGLFAYNVIDYLRYFGKWQVVYHQDFTRAGADTSTLTQSSTQLSIDEPSPAAGPEGLRLKGARTLWLKDVREGGDVRVEVVVRWPARVDGFEVNLNARREPQTVFWHCPAGYASQFGGWAGSVNVISRSETPRPPNSGNAVDADFRPGRVYRLWFERVGEDLSLYVDKRKVFTVSEPIPIAGEGLERVALRSWVDIDILSCSVWRMGSARKASPLVAGDVLVRRGHRDEAIREYLRTAADHEGNRIAEGALQRAYLVAGAVGPDADSIRDAIRQTMRHRYHGSKRWPRILEADCERMWSMGQLDTALQTAEEVLRRDRGSRIALRLLAARQDTIAPQTADRLLRLVGQTSKVIGLRLAGLGLSTLEPLRGMHLTALDCGDNHITDLEPLRGMPLRMLQMASNQVTSLAPLAGMPLELLDVADNLIADLSPLSGMPLQRLIVNRNVISSLAPLAGLPLSALNISQNKIADLEPLRGMQLLDLTCDGNGIRSLDPLSGMPLTQLSCIGCDIVSLEPLKGLPLQRLTMQANRVSDLTPLAGMKLVDLDFQENAVRDLAPLSGMPLRLLRATSNPVTSLAPLTGMPLTLLHIGDCRVSDLEPLRGLRLEKCNVYRNAITDLGPLEGMPLRVLDVHGNALTSLAPFEEEPPALFYADSVASGAAYLERVLARWNKRGSEAAARATRALVLCRRGQYRALRELALPFEGHHYLFLASPLAFDKARDVAVSAGGHLVTITSRAESEFTLSLLPEGTAGWIGIEYMADTVRWCTGEPLVYDDFTSQKEIGMRAPISQLRHTVGRGHWFAATSPSVKHGLLLEWDE